MKKNKKKKQVSRWLNYRLAEGLVWFTRLVVTVDVFFNLSAIIISGCSSGVNDKVRAGWLRGFRWVLMGSDGLATKQVNRSPPQLLFPNFEFRRLRVLYISAVALCLCMALAYATRLPNPIQFNSHRFGICYW